MNELQDKVMATLQGEKIVIVATLDAENDGMICISVLSWVLAAGNSTVRLAVDRKAKIVSNIEKNNAVSLTVFALESCYEIQGSARMRHKQLPGVSLNLSCVEIEVAGVRETMFYGGKLTREPAYTKTYNKQLADKFDLQVYSALSHD